MELTEQDIEVIYDILYNYCHYGDDEIVYTSAGDKARAVLRKVEDAAKERRIW